MRSLTIPAVLLALVGLATLAPGASAQDATLTVEAREEGCPSPRSLCLELTRGDPNAIEPGAELEIRFVNPSSTNGRHNLHVTAPDRADPDHRETPANASLASTRDIQPGESATLTVTVPEDGELYAWCDVTGHERIGMWLVLGPGTPSGGGADGVPGVGWLMAALAGIAAGLARAR